MCKSFGCGADGFEIFILALRWKDGLAVFFEVALGIQI